MVKLVLLLGLLLVVIPPAWSLRPTTRAVNARVAKVAGTARNYDVTFQLLGAGGYTFPTPFRVNSIAPPNVNALAIIEVLNGKVVSAKFGQTLPPGARPPPPSPKPRPPPPRGGLNPSLTSGPSPKPRPPPPPTASCNPCDPSCNFSPPDCNDCPEFCNW
jgi:hypothetical protein